MRQSGAKQTTIRNQILTNRNISPLTHTSAFNYRRNMASYLLLGKHHVGRGSGTVVRGGPACPSTVLTVGLGYRCPMAVLLALLMFALDPEEE